MVWAFSLSTVSVNPTGSLTPGTPVVVSFTINFASSGSDTFPSTDTLQLLTDLDKPQWTYTLILNGVENARPPAGGRSLQLSGWDLDYPAASIEESLRFTLEGNAPTVTSTGNKTLIDIVELDQNANPIPNSEVTYTTLVINTGDVAAGISSANDALQAFRALIDEKSALGVDTSAVEAQYNQAQQQIAAAQALPTSQYADAVNDLAAVNTTIQTGMTALDKAWAQKTVADAQVPVNNAESVITYLQVNKSLSNDARLSPIVAEHEIAASYITNANNAITSGNYDQARTIAQQAFTEGNKSYNDAVALNQTVNSGFNPLAGLGSIGSIFSSGVLVIVVVVIVVVLVVVGIIIYRKRSRWDELG
jgi:hypothetical protein